MSRPLKPACHDKFAKPYSNNTVPSVEFPLSFETTQLCDRLRQSKAAGSGI